jgi:hypothetical protein
MSEENQFKGENRREFLKKTVAAAISISGNDFFPVKDSFTETPDNADQPPWFRRITRWGQTNITEIDPLSYDIGWWRGHWKKTHTQGVIINAGGIIAYYPTKIPFHYKSGFLKGRDLFGELCRAAHEEGLVVFARMDSNRANEEFYKAHPDWFAVRSDGKPYRAGELYVSCVNGPYYNDHIPSILTEIATLYKPEGFTDNSWSGLGRESICYCENCKRSFKARTGKDIPELKNWDDPVYREWIRWNYDRRLEIWDMYNRITKAAGGRDCIWSGMNSGSISNQARSFRDYFEICKRADIIMLDHQARSDEEGFQNLADTGKKIHCMLGWDKLIPDSMAMYQQGRPQFRVSSKPVNEAHMWMIEGFAGGIQPWWHHIAAYHEDRRMYKTAEPVYQWHKENTQYLIDREPVATIGVIWSQENTDFYGRDNADSLVDLPWRGITQALLRSRIPYLPVNAGHIDRDASKFSLLILPNLGSLKKDQADALKRYVNNGGNLLATGESSLYDETGEMRDDFALADLYGAHNVSKTGRHENADSGRTLHTYLRLKPELRSNVYGPSNGREPVPAGDRHSVFKGFDETDILPFGGTLKSLKTDPGSETLMTYIPEFPIYPPETAWMREPKTDIPGLIINTLPSGSRIVFMPADIDRQYARYNLPDHGNLIANIVRWASKDDIPLEVKGVGLIDCNLYHQPGKMILHLTNLTNSGTWRQPIEEYISIGPITVKMRLTPDVKCTTLLSLVSKNKIPYVINDRWCQFEISSISNHEVIVIS